MKKKKYLQQQLLRLHPIMNVNRALCSLKWLFIHRQQEFSLIEVFFPETGADKKLNFMGWKNGFFYGLSFIVTEERIFRPNFLIPLFLALASPLIVRPYNRHELFANWRKKNHLVMEETFVHMLLYSFLQLIRE